MDYCFNSEIAKLYGVDEAIFIHNLYWWIAKNKANYRHCYDGRNWTYNSMDAFTKLFPFWSRRQVERIIRKLKENGAIHTANYNQRGFDKTQWYALAETVLSIYANGDIDNTVRCNGYHQTVTPIPDSKPDSKPDIPPIFPQKGERTSYASRFLLFWEAYPKLVGKGAAEKSFLKYKPDDDLLNIMLKAIEQQKKSEQWKTNGGQFIPNPSTWLNQKRWEDDLTHEQKTSTLKSYDIADVEKIMANKKYGEEDGK